MTLPWLRPQRYESVESTFVDKYLADDGWVAEQKLDGCRCLVKIDDGQVVFASSTGEPLTSWRQQQQLAEAFRPEKFKGAWAFDGELLADGTLWLFDLPLAANAGITPATPFDRRRQALELAYVHASLIDTDGLVGLVPQSKGTRAKRALWKRVQKNGGEGLCLKALDGRYEIRAGRTKSVLKVKIVATVDAVVTAVRDDPWSVDLALWDDVEGVFRAIGRATRRHDDAKVGDVMEVRYLYVGTGGRLVQPHVLRRRTDKGPRECGTDQPLRRPDRKVLPG